MSSLAQSGTLNGQELEIFRAGPHGINGKRVFTAAEVAEIAQQYGTDGHEAPNVVGHPKLDSPAFGWIKSVRADNGVLYGTFHEVPAEFDAAVEAKHYKKRSAAFDPLPDGKWRLRHVGWLGGTPPVVKGLKDATFASEQYEEFEYSTEGEVMAEQVDKKTITEMIREAFADVFGGGKDKGVQTIDVPALESRLEAKFADQLKTEREARVAAEKKFATFADEHAKGEKSASASAAVNKLKVEGKWLPAFDRMGVPELFAAAADGNTEEIEFADSKDSKKKLPTLEALTTLVGNISKFVPRGVTFGDEQAAAAAEPATKVDTTNPKIDQGSAKFDQEVRARMDKDKCDYSTAARRLAAEGKSSASYTTASAGAV